MIDRVRRYLAQDGLGQVLVKTLTGSAGLRILGMGFGFLVGVQLARGLGPAGYGVYGTAMAVITILMIPTELGLPQLVMREVASATGANWAHTANFIVRWARNRVVVSSLLITLAAGVFLVVDPSTLNPSLRNALVVGLLWIPIVALGNIYGASLRGLHRVVWGQMGEFLIRPALISLFLFLVSRLVLTELTPSLAMGLNVLAASVAAGLAWYWLKGVVSGPVGDNKIESCPSGLSFRHSVPMAMSEGMRILMSQLGMLVLAALATEAVVGQYRVAYQIYAVSTMPSALVNIACAPMIARLYSEGRRSDLARLMVWISFFLTISAITVLIFFLVFGDVAVTKTFGNQYLPALGVMVVLAASEVVASLFGHPTVLLNMVRRQRVVMWWSSVALVASAIIIIFLVPRYGAMGAALGTGLGLIVWRSGCAIYLKRNFDMNTFLLLGVLHKTSARADFGRASDEP